MNMQMNNRFYNSLSFLKTGHKFGPQAGRSKETIMLHGWGKRRAPDTTTSTPELFMSVNAARRWAPQSRAAARKGNLLMGSGHACLELSGTPEPSILPLFLGGSEGGRGQQVAPRSRACSSACPGLARVFSVRAGPWHVVTQFCRLGHG